MTRAPYIRNVALMLLPWIGQHRIAARFSVLGSSASPPVMCSARGSTHM